MEVSRPIRIDLNAPRRNVIHIEQNDTVQGFYLSLYNNGAEFDPSVGASAAYTRSVKFIKSNGADGEYSNSPPNSSTPAVSSVTGSDNTFFVRIDGMATDVPGFTELFVVFTDGSQVLHSFPVTLDIGRTESDVIPGPSANAYLRKDTQAAKTSGMTQPVGVDEDGKLWTTPGGGGGSDLPELHIGDLGKALMAVDSGEDDPEWGVAFVTEVTATITQSGSTYSVPVGTFTTLSNAISNERYVALFAPEGKAQFAGVEGTALTFVLFQDIGDVMTVVKYKIATNNSVTRTAWPVDNTAITPASIGAAVAVTVETVSESTPSITPVANHSYVCGEVAGLQITSSYAATGDWSVEFNTPQNVSCVVDLPSGLKTIPASPTFETNKHYEINCHDGYAVIAGW